ncbi:hypothetical protein XELAEV_18000185mg [Xenopus laevis]|uniref:Uncharacterized protein n=1 Tax=Xenopus laevis TaxID=8355 RepID=A0A974BPG8_XENLA|nr:hypothetical protein XELAEV_18000185mg [Xenopus laevis]
MPFEQEPWIPELGLTLLEKIALSIPNCPLNRRVVDAAQFLLKQQFITEGLQPSRTPWFNMQPVFGPAIQIHGDLEANHCFTTFYRNFQVEIAQAFPVHISPSVLKQIETIYRYVVPDALYYLQYHNVKPAEGPYDCVLYAIALAFEILNDGDLSCTFDNSKMREHLVKCFMCREITEFPKISQIS